MTVGLFEERRIVHMVGIRGSGMSGIATALAAEGHRVTGSDRIGPFPGSPLEEVGISVALGHDPANVPADADLVISSAAIPGGNLEILEARRRGIRRVKYAGALGAMMARRRGIAVAGAHGKTTVTGLTAFVLSELGADPTFVAGGQVHALGGFSGVGQGPYLVAEACEYDRSFHHLRPEVAVITNLDEDHLDYYSGIAEITEAFLEFASLLPRDGLIVTVNEHGRTFREDPGVLAPVVTVGIDKDADWVARDVEFTSGVMRFTIVGSGGESIAARLLLTGTHNVLGALLVTAVAVHLGFELKDVVRALGRFRGVGRRFDVKFRRNGLVVMDDYAHHPAEIRACLGTIRARWPNHRIWCVFQPHQASRTRVLLREFAAALSEADRVVVPEIFFARDSEEERRLISSRDLVMKVTNLGTHAEHIPDFGKIEEYLLDRLGPRDLLVTMGAGDIFRVADAVVSRLRDFGEMVIPA